MAGPPRSEIEARIRDLLAEDVPDFFDSVRLLELYDDGGSKQHRMLLDRAAERGLLANGDHDYLRVFMPTAAAAATVVDQQDYAFPAVAAAPVYRLARITFGSNPEVPARQVLFEDDWRVRNYPQWGPSAQQPLYCITPEGKLRFYVPGKGTVPAAVTNYKVYYYRDVVKSLATVTTVDIPDPWNAGPIYYAVGMALGRERTDGTHYLQLFQGCVDVIIPPLPEPAAAGGRR